MANKKGSSKPAKQKAEAKAEAKRREAHPFETESQIQNRYGNGREHAGSDGSHQAGRGSNH